jgi:hypothetical protein
MEESDHALFLDIILEPYMEDLQKTVETSVRLTGAWLWVP